MAIPFSDNLSISGKYPDITRQEYATLADLKAVKKNKMPEMYFGYCLEDHNWYAFDKQNSEDPVTGYWRVFSSGSGGDKIQFTVMPQPSAALVGAVPQYIGETTVEFTKGVFYELASKTGVSTLADMKILISNQTSTATVKLADESTVTVPAYDLSGTLYFVYEGTIYGGIPVEDVVVLADATAVETDEAVAALAIEDVIYWWSPLSSGSGGGDAADITYENADYPALDNVEKALDNLISKVYYVEPKVNSFTMAPSTTDYEIGQSVSDIVFNWTYNKDVVSQTLTDCTLADATVRTATAAGPYTATKTFTLSASDGEKTATASKTISFRHKVYWGSAASASTYDSAFILALSGKKFATNYKGTYSMNVATGEYGFLAYPDSWGMVSSWYIGGFETETFDCGTVEFTNASGNTTTFRIVRTTQPGLGEIAPEVR